MRALHSLNPQNRFWSIHERTLPHFLLSHPFLCRTGELLPDPAGPVFRFGLKRDLTELFDASALWIWKGIDYFLVPTQMARVKLAKRGIPEERIRVFSYSVRSLFFHVEVSQREAAQRLGLDLEKKTLLMSLGEQRSGNLFKFIDVR